MLTVAEDMDFFSSGEVVRTYHLWGLWGSHLFPWNCGHMTVGRGLHEGWKMSSIYQYPGLCMSRCVSRTILDISGYHKHQVYIKNINHQPHECHISTPFVFSSFVLYLGTIWGYGKPWVPGLGGTWKVLHHLSQEHWAHRCRPIAQKDRGRHRKVLWTCEQTLAQEGAENHNGLINLGRG